MLDICQGNDHVFPSITIDRKLIFVFIVVLQPAVIIICVHCASTVCCAYYKILWLSLVVIFNNKI